MTDDSQNYPSPHIKIILLSLELNKKTKKSTYRLSVNECVDYRIGTLYKIYRTVTGIISLSLKTLLLSVTNG